MLIILGLKALTHAYLLSKTKQKNNIKKCYFTRTSLLTNLVLLTEASSATRNSCSVVHNQAETADKPHLRLIS